MTTGFDPVSWQQAMPMGAGGVPSAPAASTNGSGSDSIDKMIATLASPIDPELVKQATSPMAGPRVAQVPTSLQTPITPFKPVPLNNAPVVGAGNARARGIGNAITGVTNAIGKIATAELQHKQNQVRDAAQKLITAQQAIDEAQQQHDMATKNGDTEGAAKYQQLIDQNTKVKDGIFADPKMRKALQKGFDISYTDPASNKTDEHKAVQEAIKNAKTADEKKKAIADFKAKQNQQAAQGMSKAWTEQQPRSMAPNTQAQAQLQAQLAQQKIQQQMIKDLLTYKAAMSRTGAMVSLGQMRVQSQLLMKQAQFDHEQDMLNQRFENAQKLQGIRFSDEIKAMYTRAGLARKTAREIYADRQDNPLAIYTKTRQAYTTFSQNAMKDMTTLQALQQQRQSMYVDAKGHKLTPNPADVQQIDANINFATAQLQQDKQSAQNFQEQANQMATTFGYNEGSADGGDSGSSNSSGAETSGGEEPDFADPMVYLGGDRQE